MPALRSGSCGSCRPHPGVKYCRPPTGVKYCSRRSVSPSQPCSSVSVLASATWLHTAAGALVWALGTQVATAGRAAPQVCCLPAPCAGVLIRSINPTSAAAQVLKPDDVLMKFDGVEIACDGTVPFRTGERISFSYLISNKFVGDDSELQVLRKGEVLQLKIA
jgi:hypothetical protein